jgi:hypothetical protein
MTIKLSDVQQAILIDNSNARVILLNYRPAIGVRNIYCVTQSGEIKWQIPKPDKIPDNKINYFVGIDLIDDVLHGYTLNGILYQIDKESGQLLHSEFIK